MPEKITDQSQDRTSGDICKKEKEKKQLRKASFILGLPIDDVFSQNDGNRNKLEEVLKWKNNKGRDAMFSSHRNLR